ncbi:MAG UNVERIFIED_CONTAM: hypothetical protein LVR29_27530 [Microcystis novacekii LVE1205-3]|jgi:hypothetical protein
MLKMNDSIDMDSDKYVSDSHSHILGDLVEIIHFNGGVLPKIVQNIPESRPNYRPSLRQHLERFQDAHYNPHAVNQFYPVSVQLLADFRPQEDEKYIIGFTGFKMLKLVQYLTKVFNFNFTPLIHPRASIAGRCSHFIRCDYTGGSHHFFWRSDQRAYFY